jgi:hypothetical protein
MTTMKKAAAVAPERLKFFDRRLIWLRRLPAGRSRGTWKRGIRLAVAKKALDRRPAPS